jgi:hypothetical protein
VQVRGEHPACHHQAPADLQAIVDGDRGAVPLVHLWFRSVYGSRLTDSVVTAGGEVLAHDTRRS